MDSLVMQLLLKSVPVLLLLMLGFWQYLRVRQRERTWVTCQATIIEIIQRPAFRAGTTLVPIVEITNAAGHRWRSRPQTNQPLGDLKIGASISVQYNPDNPESFDFAKDRVQYLPAILPVVLAAIWAAATILFSAD
jgi:hypothetical protein